MRRDTRSKEGARGAHLDDALALGDEGILLQGAVGRVHDDVGTIVFHERADGGADRGSLLTGAPLADAEDDGRRRAEEARVPRDDAGRGGVDVQEADVVARNALARIADDFVLRRPRCHAHAHHAGQLRRDRANQRRLAYERR